MALQLKIRVKSKTIDLSQVTIADDNAALDSIYQYGGANPERADLGLFLYVWAKKLNGEADVQIPCVNVNTTTATEWTYTISEDNVYEHLLIAAPVHNSGVQYELNYLVAYSDRIYISLQAGNIGRVPSTENEWWRDVTDDPLYARDTADESSYTWTIFSEANCDRAQVYFAKYIAQITADGQCGDCDADVMVKKNRIEVLIQAVQVNEYQYKWLKAQAVIEALKTMYVL